MQNFNKNLTQLFIINILNANLFEISMKYSSKTLKKAQKSVLFFFQRKIKIYNFSLFSSKTLKTIVFKYVTTGMHHLTQFFY